jgi:hypothetical protein
MSWLVVGIAAWLFLIVCACLFVRGAAILDKEQE